MIELRGIKADSGAGAASAGPDQAVKLLEEAVAAAEKGRDDGRRAEAATELALAHRDAGRLAEADRWVKFASSVVTRIGDPPTLRAAVDFVLGWLHYDRRDLGASAAAYERSLRLRRQALGQRAPEVLASMAGVCRAKELDVPASSSCYREAVALGRTIVGPRHVELARLNANLAGVLRQDARTRPEACRLLEEGLRIAEAAVDPGHRSVVNQITLLAECYKDEGRNDDARRLYLDGIRRATTVSGARGDLLQAYGIFLARFSDWEGAVHQLRAAVADREAIFGATHNWALESRYSVADTLRRAGRPGEALQELDEAIAACEKAGATGNMYPDLHELRGLTLQTLGKREEAYRALERAVELHEKLGTPETLRWYALQSIGSLERVTGRLDASIAHLEKAVALRPLEVDPQSFAEGAIELAMALGAKGPATRPRACTLARQALTGFSAPRGGPPRPEVKQVRRWLARQRCDTTAPAPSQR